MEPLTAAGLGAGVVLAAALAATAHAQGPVTNEPPAIKERQDARFPQPVRVGAMVGWPVIQSGGRYRRLGVVVGVFQPTGGDPELVFRYERGLFQPSRLIAPDLDDVVLVGAMVKIADVEPDDLDKLPSFRVNNGRLLGPNEVVRIGLGKKY
jgi:hypothetical protein